MKKTFLTFCSILLTASMGIHAQELFPKIFENTSSSLPQLLERLEIQGASFGIEPANLFTPGEESLIKEYFNSLTHNSENTLLDSEGLAYAVQIYGGCNETGFGTFSLNDPDNFDVINSNNPIFYAGDEDGSGRLFGLVVEGVVDHRCVFVEIDKETGVYTEVAELDIFQTKSQLPTGISWNPANNTMYMIGSTTQETELYTIDLETAELTSIGLTGIAKGNWLAIDSAGNGYVLDIGLRALFSVNLETAASANIGAVGVPLSYGQDADFDPASGILYTVGYLGSGVNNLYSVDLDTGAYTSHGPVNNNCAQMGVFSIESNTMATPKNEMASLSFFPNPSTGYISFQSEEPVSNVSIYNIVGQKVYETSLDKTSGDIDISSLQKGVYFIETTINGKKEVNKVIKK